MQRIEFDGILDESTRRSFREKRWKYRLSYNKLADILDVSWLTIRNWELGISRKCHTAFISRINGFLNGEFDEELRIASKKLSRRHNEKGLPPIPCPGASLMLDNIRTTYHVCHDSAGLCADMLARIRKLSKATLRQYIGTVNGRL